MVMESLHCKYNESLVFSFIFMNFLFEGEIEEKIGLVLIVVIS